MDVRMDGTVLAIDIGGTKMAAALVDGVGRVLAFARTETPAGAEAEHLFDALAGAVGEVRQDGAAKGLAEPSACGVGTGGPMTSGGATVSPVNIHGWRGFPLRSRIEALTRL